MIYLNSAATSYPKPPSVTAAVLESIESMPSEAGRSTLNNDHKVWECRSKIAKLLHVTAPEDIHFTSGATESANLAIYGLSLNGAHVVTTTTEHNCILRPLYRHRDMPEITCVHSDSCGYIAPEDIEKAIQKNTKAIFVNHCSNVTGTVQDLETIGKIAKRYGLLFVVDASQSLGCLPIDVEKQHIDVLIFTGHKYLFGISGIGGLYIRKGTPVKPVKVGGTGMDSRFVRLPENYSVFECGTYNIPGIWGLLEGIKFLEKNGYERVYRYLFKTTIHVLKVLYQLPNIEIYQKNPLMMKENLITERPDTYFCGPVISFNICGFTPADAGYLLSNGYGIILRTGLHCCPMIHQDIGSGNTGTVRISFSYQTSRGDIDGFEAAIKDICGNIG